MASCPHCGQEIEFVQGGKSIWTRNLTPGLGCGSFVAIAAIVFFCSGKGTPLFFPGQGTPDDLQRLSANVKSLETKVDTLTESVNRLNMPPKKP